ncbi:hypothetical protein HPP92_017201 [Vanilla planifolia]|uniref:Uncharacterized protein n=1 Tax=Vanilla planifolia TaxID=51239 RepID=A0A835UND2_VANPL|nr:hypothetical protein HPP92_017779 [Vanilla planifolia]KAG0467873.1 hypothetical protein HPP92_017201 [Vanilla planifolia]
MPRDAKTETFDLRKAVKRKDFDVWKTDGNEFWRVEKRSCEEFESVKGREIFSPTPGVNEGTEKQKAGKLARGRKEDAFTFTEEERRLRRNGGDVK